MSIRRIIKLATLAAQGLAVVVGMALAPVALAGTQQEEMFVADAACSDKATTIEEGAKCSKGNSQATSLFGNGGIFTVVANTLIFLVGAISVIMVIFGAFKYVTSNGDSKAVTSAKDTILYAVVGVVLAIISYAIINFVIVALNTAK